VSFTYKLTRSVLSENSRHRHPATSWWNRVDTRTCRVEFVSPNWRPT